MCLVVVQGDLCVSYGGGASDGGYDGGSSADVSVVDVMLVVC